MRRRVKEASGPVNVLAPPKMPPYEDDYSLPAKERLSRWDAWVERYYRPWRDAKNEYEDAHGVVVVDAKWREFYGDSRRVVFVNGVPEMPEAPWDEDAI